MCPKTETPIQMSNLDLYGDRYRCECALIAQARADERERIAQRIEGIEHDIFCASWYERDCDCICSETIAAVRGES